MSVKRSKKLNIAAIIGEIIQPNPIQPNKLYFILYAFLYKPIPIIAPTIVCELDTGTNGKEGKPYLSKKVLVLKKKIKIILMNVTKQLQVKLQYLV